MELLSCSQINLYLLCGQKFKYQYIDKLPKPFKSSAFAFGCAIHSSLAWLHKQIMKGEKISTKMLLEIFNSDWYCQNLETQIRFKESENELSLVSMAKEFLTIYLENNHIEVKAYGTPYRVPFIDPSTGEILDFQLGGFIKLIETDGTIVDFKISTHKMSEREVHRNLRLTANSYAYQMLYNKLPRCVKMVNLIKTEDQRISTIEIKFDESDYKGFFYLVNAVLKGIRSEVFIPRNGYWCKDCEYFSICPNGSEVNFN